MSSRGAVITWSMTNAEALIIGDIDVDSSRWAQNLIRITEFCVAGKLLPRLIDQKRSKRH